MHHFFGHRQYRRGTRIFCTISFSSPSPETQRSARFAAKFTQLIKQLVRVRYAYRRLLHFRADYSQLLLQLARNLLIQRLFNNQEEIIITTASLFRPNVVVFEMVSVEVIFFEFVRYDELQNLRKVKTTIFVKETFNHYCHDNGGIAKGKIKT